ncbi:MAG: hypothetical protein M1818_004785 [Claussenomyces sp. TS43310]|nr:MAG: hypothetical protein M1818_004785 [Claussenomyces sp. TS43310]
MSSKTSGREPIRCGSVDKKCSSAIIDYRPSRNIIHTAKWELKARSAPAKAAHGEGDVFDYGKFSAYLTTALIVVVDTVLALESTESRSSEMVSVFFDGWLGQSEDWS